MSGLKTMKKTSGQSVNHTCFSLGCKGQLCAHMPLEVTCVEIFSIKCRYKYPYIISCDTVVQADVKLFSLNVVWFIFSAQFAGLLCEEEGNGADNVQYCGYCKYHFSKLVCICEIL